MIFQNIEGSIVAKASQDEEKKEEVQNDSEHDLEEDSQKILNSYTAVLANICHEYIEFGLEAFEDNKFQ